jgi:hypothetical protein
MTLTSPLPKFVVTGHITFAVGWLGAVAGFLAPAIAELNSQDTQIMKAAYLGMDLTGRYVIPPLIFAPLSTGPILSLGTHWGLFSALLDNCETLDNFPFNHHFAETHASKQSPGAFSSRWDPWAC